MQAEDWETMWSADGGLKPGEAFDAKGCEPALVTLIASGNLPKGRGFVAGCGRGYAVAALANEKRTVTGLEISESAQAAAQDHLRITGSAAWAKVVLGDFFNHEPVAPYDLAFDSTFLCAIDPRRRLDWANKYADLIRLGGELIVNVFPIGDHDGGPPFALSPQIVADLLEPAGFELIQLSATPEDNWARGRMEYLSHWRRSE